MVKVSIITVCYNSEATISRTIESVLKQSYTNIEYVIVDGQSKDNTGTIIEEYYNCNRQRMKYISEPDKGIYDAMNKGISMCTGELIGILNSDDFYEADAVENVIKAMKNEPYQVLYGFVRAIKNNVEFSIDRQSHLFLNERMIGHPACFVTKKIYDDLGGFDLRYISVADYDFMLRISLNPMVHFIPVDALITNFTLGGMSATDAAWLDLLKLRKNYGMISARQYKKEILKSIFYNFYRKLKKLG